MSLGLLTLGGFVCVLAGGVETTILLLFAAGRHRGGGRAEQDLHVPGRHRTCCRHEVGRKLHEPPGTRADALMINSG